VIKDTLYRVILYYVMMRMGKSQIIVTGSYQESQGLIDFITEIGGDIVSKNVCNMKTSNNLFVGVANLYPSQLPRGEEE
jgi:hypothetical protein